MQLVTDEQGNAVVRDNCPVYRTEDGKEIAFDVPKLMADMRRVNAENAERRKTADTLAEKLKAFEAIKDPEEAIKALELKANLDQSKLLDAGKVEALKEEVKKAVANGYEAKLEALSKDLDSAKASATDKDSRIKHLLIKGLFDASKYLSEKTVLPPDVAHSYFGQNIEIEEDGDGYRLVGKISGVPIPSPSNPIHTAQGDEIIEALVNQSPFKDRLLKGAPGGSGTPGLAGGSAGAKTLTRSQFESLAAADQMSFVKDGGKVVDAK